MTSDDRPVDVGAVMERLKRTVAERRAAGMYPEGLEDELDARLDQLVSASAPEQLDHLAELGARAVAGAAAVDAASGFGTERIDYGSRMPGGSALHRTVARAVSRQTIGVLTQMQAFSAAIGDTLRAVVEIQQLQTQMLATLDGRLTHLEGVTAVDTAATRRQLRDLERAVSNLHLEPFFTSAAFEASFRGDEDDLGHRYEAYADDFVGAGGRVVDLGCGRGEFVRLLLDRGVDAVGIEVDPALVDAARRDGLDVELADATEWLGAQDDASLGGIVAIQVVEHLPAQQTSDLVALAHRKLLPGARLLIETVNVQSVYAATHAFPLDPTHVRPVHDAYLRFLVEEIGFSHHEVHFSSPPPESDRMVELSGEGDGPLVDALNENFRRLNDFLFAPQDYAIVAVR